MRMNGKENEKGGLRRPERNSVRAAWLPGPPSAPGPGACWTQPQLCRRRAEGQACGKRDRNPGFAGRRVLVVSPVQL